jgi:hypothetical protein
MARKKQDSRFIDSVPEVIKQVRCFQAETLGNPAIPFPWPPYVAKPEALDRQIEYLQRVWEAGENKEARTGGKLGRARKDLKTCFSQLARYVALTLEGRSDLAGWPGFDLGRNPGESRTRSPYRCSPPVVSTEDDI